MRRSTRVATADWLRGPTIRSPSQPPRRSRSSTTGGRWSMRRAGATNLVARWSLRRCCLHRGRPVRSFLVNTLLRLPSRPGRASRGTDAARFGRASRNATGRRSVPGFQVEFRLDPRLQLGVLGELGATSASGALAAAVVGHVGVVYAIVVRQVLRRSSRLTVDGVRPSPAPGSSGPTRARCYPAALQQRQVPVGAGSSPAAGRRSRPAIGSRSCGRSRAVYMPPPYPSPPPTAARTQPRSPAPASPSTHPS